MDQVNVWNLPKHVAPDQLTGSTVVVIDLLRATTTICHALAVGASEVIPFLEIEDVRAALQNCDRSTILLGGERGGRRIDGFDLGNSPSEYTAETVAGRRVFLTTTNGTRALHRARLAERVLVGSFVNLSAVAASVRNSARLDILCAGTDGQETGEDILAAGALVDRALSLPSHTWQPSDTAIQARREWRRAVAAASAASRSVSDQLAREFRDAPGGRNLVEIDLERDLIDCAQIDRVSIVPELDVQAWRITAPKSTPPLR